MSPLFYGIDCWKELAKPMYTSKLIWSYEQVYFINHLFLSLILSKIFVQTKFCSKFASSLQDWPMV